MKRIGNGQQRGSRIQTLGMFWIIALWIGSLIWIGHATSATNRIGPVSRALLPYIQNHEIAGAVTLVGTSTGMIHLETVGWADIERHRPMQPDTMFWIASMTKPMTAVCVMMLQEEGKLNIHDPVEKYLPEFRGQRMVVERKKDRIVLAPPPRPITIRDLLTHTSGLARFRSPRPNATLAELVMAYAREPLQFAPGTRWAYSNEGINTLGRIIEVVSGIPYAQFIQERLFDPLGMRDTTFWPNAEQVQRLATSYRRTPDGRLVPTNIYFLQGELSDRSRTPFPSGGLFSTAQDVYKFYRMLLRGGVAGSKRILRPETIREMTSLQTGDLHTGFVPGMGWGLGFGVVRQPQGITGMLHTGSFGHGGAYGTQSWADPKQDLILILMVQRANFPNSDASPVRWAFQKAAVQWFGKTTVPTSSGK